MMRSTLLAIVFVLGCMTGVIQSRLAAQGDLAYIRFAHAAVGTAPTDLYVEEQITAVQALDFGDVSEWFAIAPGTYTILPASSGRVPKEFFTYPLKIEASDDDRITISLIGSEGRDTLALQPVYQNGNELPPGEARLSIFHAIESIGPVNVLANGSALFQFVNYPRTDHDQDGSVNDGFATVDIVANTYEFEVVSFINPDNVLIDLGEIQLLPNYHYWIAIMGASAPFTFSMEVTDVQDRATTRDDLLTVQAPQDAEGRLRVAHFSSGTPALDVFVDRERIIEGLTFADVSDFVVLPVGNYQLALVPSGLNVRDALIPPVEVDIEADRSILTAVIGTLANDSLTAQVVEENFRPIPNSQVRMSVFQAIPGIAPVNVQLDDGSVLVRLLGYPGSQGSNDGYEVFELTASTYDLEVVNAAETREVIVSLDNQLLIGGRNYLLATIRAEPPYILMFTEVDAD